MSSAIQPRTRSFRSDKSIVVIASKFNEEMTNGLLENCLDELRHVAPNASVEVIRVPGAYEIPVVASIIAHSQEKKTNIIIALGLILRGGTDHGDLIAASVTDSLQTLAVNTLTPIINQVLLVEDEKQAYARCIAQRINRGREAARAASAMLETCSALESNYL